MVAKTHRQGHLFFYYARCLPQALQVLTLTVLALLDAIGLPDNLLVIVTSIIRGKTFIFSLFVSERYPQNLAI